MENPRRLLSALLLADSLVNLPLILLCLWLLRERVAATVPFLGSGAADFRADRFRLRSHAEAPRAGRGLSARGVSVCASCTR